jgi:hypothetical protein
MNEAIERQKKLSDRADEYLAAAIAKGYPFSENLSNWAWDKAEKELTTGEEK